MKRKVLLFCVIFSSLLAMGCNDIKQGNVAVTQENTSEEQIIIDSKDTETTGAATSDEAVEEVDDTMKNVEEIAYSEISSNEIEVASEPAASTDEENILRTEDGKIIVDLVMFMGQNHGKFSSDAGYGISDGH